MKSPLISVIIISHSSESTIASCVKSLTSQSYPKNKFEIIVVDDSSNDNSVDLAKTAGADNVIVIPSSTTGYARNKGVEKAQGKILAFLDSDCEAKEGWLKTIEKNIGSEEKNAFTGPIENGKKDSLVSWAEYFLCFCGYDDYRNRSKTRMLPGCNNAMSKNSYMLTKGFKNKVTSHDDVHFGEELSSVGVNMYFIPEMKIQHLGLTIKQQFLSKMKRRGAGFISTRREYKNLPGAFLAKNLFWVFLLFPVKFFVKLRYAIRAKKLRMFIRTFHLNVLGIYSFCKGAWEEIKSY